jgi:hypothetical protein
LLDVAGAQLEVLGDVGHRAFDDEFGLAIFVKVFVNLDATGLAGFFRIRVHRQIFVLDLNQFYRRLRCVFILGGDRRNGLADKAHFALRQEGLVFNRLAVRPGCVFAGHDGYDAGKFLRLFGLNAFDLRVGLRAEEGFSMEHVREHEIVAIDRLAG